MFAIVRGRRFLVCSGSTVSTLSSYGNCCTEFDVDEPDSLTLRSRNTRPGRSLEAGNPFNL
jgi:hypothetical protein